MKDYMDKIDIYSFPLLQWIINSNRSHIEKLHPSKVRFIYLFYL